MEAFVAQKIMIVDDDPSLGDLYQNVFKTEGYDVVWVSDGENALARILEEKPDLILLDIMMPKIQGLDVLDIVKATPQTEKTKIVVMSALSDEEIINKAKEYGAVDFLVKSKVDMGMVVKRVKEILADSAAS
jgi:DNA-binding response OmpR family regulator